MTQTEVCGSGFLSRAFIATIMINFACGDAPPEDSPGAVPSVGLRTMPDELALLFAPVMWLHEDEEYPPMSAERFASKSRLWWVRLDGTRYVLDPQEENPERKWKEISDAGKPWSDDDAIEVGYLDSLQQAEKEVIWLEHKAQPVAEKPDLIVQEPVYYAYQDFLGCPLISYWFFFGYSFPLHQGDWETVSVLVDGADGGGLARVWFNAHGKYMWQDPSQVHFDPETGRLMGHFALGRHATYPDTGSWKAPGPPEDLGSVTEIVDGADTLRAYMFVPSIPIEDDVVGAPTYRWDAAMNLVAIENAVWKSYNGGWGKARTNLLKFWNGPSGPWEQKRDRLYNALMTQADSLAEANGLNPGDVQCATVAASPWLTY